MKVFVTGFNRTGTTSLGEACQLLGLSVLGLDRQTFVEVVNGRWGRAFALADAYQAFHDWPWGLVYKQMSVAYPDAKFILTERDEDQWFESMLRYGKTHHIDTIYRRVMFGKDPKEQDRDHCQQIYRTHNQAVRNWFAKSPERLLILPTDEFGWEPVCNFLGLDKLPFSFPHVNRSHK